MGHGLSRSTACGIFPIRDRTCVPCIGSRIPFSLFFFPNLFKGTLLHHLASAIPQHESAIDIHVPTPFLTSLPPPTPSHPARLLQSSGLRSLSHTAGSHWLSILHMVVYMLPCYSLHSSHPPSPSPATSMLACAHTSFLCVCISTVGRRILNHWTTKEFQELFLRTMSSIWG